MQTTKVKIRRILITEDDVSVATTDPGVRALRRIAIGVSKPLKEQLQAIALLKCPSNVLSMPIVPCHQEPSVRDFNVVRTRPSVLKPSLHLSKLIFYRKNALSQK
jgi:hypothetical protein